LQVGHMFLTRSSGPAQGRKESRDSRNSWREGGSMWQARELRAAASLAFKEERSSAGTIPDDSILLAIFAGEREDSS
jgi:hypothetical protein